MKVSELLGILEPLDPDLEVWVSLDCDGRGDEEVVRVEEEATEERVVIYYGRGCQ